MFLSHLPLEEDHDEDAVVYSCLLNVFRREDILSDEKRYDEDYVWFKKHVREELIEKDKGAGLGEKSAR